MTSKSLSLSLVLMRSDSDALKPQWPILLLIQSELGKVGMKTEFARWAVVTIRRPFLSLMSHQIITIYCTMLMCQHFIRGEIIWWIQSKCFILNIGMQLVALNVQ